MDSQIGYETISSVSSLIYKLYQNDWYWGMLDFLKYIKNIKYLTIPIFCY